MSRPPRHKQCPNKPRQAPSGRNPRAGRPRGTPNKATTAVREAIALFAEQNVGKLQIWLDATARRNPEKAAEMFLRALEYYIPKLGRLEHAGEDGRELRIVLVDPTDRQGLLQEPVMPVRQGSAEKPAKTHSGPEVF